MVIQYSPISHFFVNYKHLLDADIDNSSADSFGPLDGDRYRVTSKIRSSVSSEVYAICNGRILIQPQADDDTKINIILKPERAYSPLKIKYFIYRGVDKSDWFDISNNLKQKAVGDSKQPTLLQNAWDDFIRFHTTISGAVVPSVFPATSIGYDPDNKLNDLLIDSFFHQDTAFNPNGVFQLLPCKEGDYIGNFSTVIGLDVVLDYGDYKLANQEELFKFDLLYARQKDVILDITTIPISTVIDNNGLVKATRVKRYREYIHQFIDAAAFWGSHIECGSITLNNNISKLIADKTSIVSDILSKYHTGKKVYLYIQDDSGKSYNYYDALRKINGFTPGGEFYNTANVNPKNWPILIKELSATASDNSVNVQVSLQYEVADRVDASDAFITLDLIAPNNNSKNYPLIDHLQLGNTPPYTGASLKGDTIPMSINFQSANSITCATFCFVYSNITQKFPLENYYNNLWPANLDVNFRLPADSNDLMYWATCDRNRIVNLKNILNISASIQNKVVFDTGKNGVPTKKRRLFIAMLKQSSSKLEHVSKLNVSSLNAGFSSNHLSAQQYSGNVYNNHTSSVYKSTILGGLTDVLSLVDEEDFERKFSYFHLGISNAQYNMLIYHTETPGVSTPQQLPRDADNVLFYLSDVSSPSSSFKKFKVGLTYEDNLGSRVAAPLFPPSDVYVYTIDGFYFSSTDFSEFQTFYEEFSDCSVKFRPLSGTHPWKGEFGFDWVRVGDTGYPGDNTLNNQYFSKLGHYYNSTDTTIKLDPDQNSAIGATILENEKLEWMKYRNQFPIYPIKNDFLAYSASYLSLYPSKDKNGLTAFPKHNSDSSQKCLVEATLELLINIAASPSSFKIKFETGYFEITEVNRGDLMPVVNTGQYSYLEIINKRTTGTNSRALQIKVKSLNEFSVNKKIQILANDKIAGELEVPANDKQSRKQVKVVFVSLTTWINGRIRNGQPQVKKSIKFNDLRDKTDEIIEKKINMAFNQMLIDVIDIRKIDLDVSLPITISPGDVFDFNAKYIANPGTRNAKIDSRRTRGIHGELFKALSKQYPLFGQLRDYFFIFYVGVENSTSIVGGQLSHTNGSTEKFKGNNVVVYQAGIIDPLQPPSSGTVVNDTSIHELMHACGLYHTFSNINNFTHEKFSTDNLMDYVSSSSNNISNRFSLSKYQKSNIESHFLIKPE